MTEITNLREHIAALVLEHEVRLLVELMAEACREQVTAESASEMAMAPWKRAADVLEKAAPLIEI